MSKDNENRKLEIILPLEVAERLYQVLTDLVAILSQEYTDSGRIKRLEKGSFSSFVQQKKEAEEADVEEIIRVLKLAEDVKKIVIEDIEAALKRLQSSLSTTSKTNSEVVNLLSRHNRVTKALNNGTIQFSIADNEYNKIVNALLIIIDNLDEESLENDDPLI